MASAAVPAFSRVGCRGAMRIKPTYYHEQAQLSRELAERTDDPEISLHLLSVAKQFAISLIHNAERRTATGRHAGRNRRDVGRSDLRPAHHFVITISTHWLSSMNVRYFS
jgi:hypothetical protein